MRKMFLFIAAVMCWAMTAQAETWTSGACTVTLENGVMTVSGNGAMADYVDYTLRPWNTYISHITSIVIEEGVTAVGYNSFYSCDALTSLSIAKSVTVIMEYAFEDCTALTSIVIPEGVVTIRQKAFSACDHVTKAYLPSSLGYIGEDVFINCDMLTDVYCAADPDRFEWYEAGCDDFKRPIRSKTTRCHVPAQYLDKYIQQYSTGNDETDVNVTFVADIPYFWFSGETMVVFDENGEMTVSALPGTAGRMADYELEEDMPWFAVRNQVSSIKIEDGVTKLGKNAFYLCTAVLSCTCLATTPPVLNSNLFYFTPAEQVIYVPVETLEAYREAWGDKVGTERIQPIGGEGIEEVVESRKTKDRCAQRQKLLIDGELYILRDGKIFNVQGARVK
ncbi:MAG: leucine-rich repeat domain-containing protein [Paludibacteraceae bacterium]|nr:leucine-rich repeat domain-containing protein [Paludibacteraceae bacterium]